MNVNRLTQRFDEALLEVFRRARDEAGYHATRFFQMLMEIRGVKTARTLLHADTVSDGYTALWEPGRLDLTVEAAILDPQWNPLFDNNEREIARQRLAEYGYAIAAEEHPEDGHAEGL